MDFEKRDVVVGAAVLAAALLLGAVWWRINRERLVAKTYRLQINLADIGGVDKGTEVIYRGYRAGAVDRIDIDHEPRFRFVVWLGVKQELRLKHGTKVMVRDKGFGGSKYLELVASPEEEGGEALADGALLPVVSQLDLMGKANEVLAEVQKVVREFQKSGATGEVLGVLHQAKSAAVNANAVMVRLDTAVGNANKLLVSLNAMVEENRAGLSATVRHAGSASSRTDELLGKKEEALRQTLDNIRESTKHLPKILINVEELTEELKRRPWRLLRKSDADPLKLDHAHPAEAKD